MLLVEDEDEDLVFCFEDFCERFLFGVQLVEVLLVDDKDEDLVFCSDAYGDDSFCVAIPFSSISFVF